MGRQRNRRIFAGFYRRYDGRYIYVVAVVPDADTDEKVVIFHYGTEACGCKYYTMTKNSFCEQVEVNREWVDKFTRQPQVKITDTHISNLEEAGFPGPIRKKQPKDAEEHGMNRGSADYINKKFISELAAALKARDDSDGVCRLSKN